MTIDFSRELLFKTSRSSGAGGQNVNKVETAVTVLWRVEESISFNQEEKEMILQKLKNRISADGHLQITAKESRTQLQNKKVATERIITLVNESIIKPKSRKATKPSKAKIEKRLETKKRLSDKKENRRFRY